MSKTILVVEDDSDMRALINRHLLNAGYVVRIAANGLEAAAACLSVTPDLIISDVHMPRMNGFEMIAILKSEPAMADIPVIFLTADAKGRKRGNKLGAVEYLTKPLRLDSLLAAVARHLPAQAAAA
jgi:two-component system, chemotaxis family, chemotaxis protein CheY